MKNKHIFTATWEGQRNKTQTQIKSDLHWASKLLGVRGNKGCVRVCACLKAIPFLSRQRKALTIFNDWFASPGVNRELRTLLKKKKKAELKKEKILSVYI